MGGRGHVGLGGGECQALGAQRVEKGPWPSPGCSWWRLVLPWAWPGLEALWWEGPRGSQIGGSLDPQQTWRWWARLERWTEERHGTVVPQPVTHSRASEAVLRTCGGMDTSQSMCSEALGAGISCVTPCQAALGSGFSFLSPYPDRYDGHSDAS